MTNIVFEQKRTQEILGSVQNNIGQLQLLMAHAQDIQPQVESLSAEVETLRTASTSLGNHGLPTKAPSKNLGPFIRVAATVQQVCHKSCMCRCHNKTTMKSPTWVQNLVGTLFIGTYFFDITLQFLMRRIE